MQVAAEGWMDVQESYLQVKAGEDPLIRFGLNRVAATVPMDNPQTQKLAEQSMSAVH